MHPVTTYRALLDISRKMPALAEQQAWDELAILESQRAGLIVELSKAAGTALTDGEEIAGLIRQIQALDEEVLEYVLPWRAHAATLLERLRPASTETT